MSSKKRTTPFRLPHQEEYGLRVAIRHPSTGQVTSVTCRFCEIFGREEKVGQKRKPATTTKSFRMPFRPETYRQHLSLQHPTRWAEYSAASTDEKRNYFSAPPRSNTLRNYFAGVDDQLFFRINAPIVDVVLRRLLLNEDDDETGAQRALSRFEPEKEPSSDVIVAYKVQVKNLKLFKFVAGLIALGSSFRMVARQVECARSTLSLGLLAGCKEERVSFFARVILASCLQTLSHILSSTWAFSVAFDAATIQTTSYFDVRIRFAKGPKLYCFHLFSLPLLGRHTGENMFDVFNKAMSAVCPSWPKRLLSVCSDGARNMTGRVKGISTRISAVVESEGNTLIRFWCGAHQLDLVVQDVVSSFCNSEFYSTLTSLISFLRRQQSLVAEMKSKCPLVSSTRWLSLGRVLSWLSRHRLKIMEFVSSATTITSPTKKWWIAALSLHQICQEIDILFKKLQYSTLLVSQQQAAFAHFISSLSALTGLSGPNSVSSAANASSDTIRNGAFEVSQTSIEGFIQGCGSFVQDMFDELASDEKVDIVQAVGQLSVDLALKVHLIEPEQCRERIYKEGLPPCLPHELASMTPGEFVSVILRYRARLQKVMTAEEIGAVEEDQRGIRRALQNEPAIKAMMMRLSSSSSFQVAWAPLEERFPNLCKFAGGISTIYPGTSRVESDFSIMKWEKNDYRTSLMDLSLEGIMHAKQFKELQTLV